MKCNECCGDGYNLRIVKKGNGYATERVTCEHCHGTGEVEMTEPKLKPCPFCGGEADIDTYYSNNGFFDEPTKIYKVFCQNCLCQTDEEYIKDKAIETWNKRVVAK